MAFNANTYHANRLARQARENLAKARDIKARLANGEAYDWEAPRVAHFVKLAVLDARMARSYRALRQLQKDRP